MTREDEMCFLRLWDTSPAAARRRYRGDRRPAYDDLPPLGPRDYMARCVHCGGTVVVGSTAGGEAQRRYCSRACRDRAYYYRHRERLLAGQRAYRDRDRAAYRADRRAERGRHREERVTYHRDKRAHERVVA